MLTLTPNASTIVKTIADQSAQESETAQADQVGLRISSEESTPEEFTVATADAPAEGDEVVESEGARVFLSETASTVLADKVLDAQVDEAGAVTFQLGELAE
ncbi:Fe-S cluster assembly protein HesB [Spelaeicoccus albus]|uniref:Fe-S cluster assembly iron-binding protein IscA n=1 Tax=Spelaeicoccus albus TaxID=1280376 RepID=A0A7Z0D1Z1_9MICO|nr:Fe-S cluster assembly protein HesB [Spelaeicoccus albus]NYI67272.1 Fe-S cluster assembly iron-binding protein IscA [Spelaeicoccus albus]